MSENFAAENRISLTVQAEDAGERLDKFLTARLSGFSRSRIQNLIHTSHISVRTRKESLPGLRLRDGDIVDVRIPEPEPLDLSPKPVDFRVLFEDPHILILEKPPGISIHPGAGKEETTLVHGLLFHCGDLSGIGGRFRPGIVHRLDKDTSGLMVIAKNDASHMGLAGQFMSGTVGKTYFALVNGHMKTSSGRITQAIGRHPVHRKKMSVASRTGRDARSEWEVIREFPGASLLAITIRTGRTHQIRVHMSAAGHPVLGDMLYGGPSRLTLQERSITVPRQMLHAARLAIVHPVTGEAMEWRSGMPEDMGSIVSRLAETS